VSNGIFTAITVSVVKRDSSYSKLRFYDHIVNDKSVFICGYCPALSFHPQPAVGIISFLSTAGKLRISKMQLGKKFASGGRKLKETSLNLMRNPTASVLKAYNNFYRAMWAFLK
jgi:hypothetical protein